MITFHKSPQDLAGHQGLEKAPDRCSEWFYVVHILTGPNTVKEALPSHEKNEWIGRKITGCLDILTIDGEEMTKS